MIYWIEAGAEGLPQASLKIDEQAGLRELAESILHFYDQEISSDVFLETELFGETYRYIFTEQKRRELEGVTYVDGNQMKLSYVLSGPGDSLMLYFRYQFVNVYVKRVSF